MADPVKNEEETQQMNADAARMYTPGPRAYSDAIQKKTDAVEAERKKIVAGMSDADRVNLAAADAVYGNAPVVDVKTDPGRQYFQEDKTQTQTQVQTQAPQTENPAHAPVQKPSEQMQQKWAPAVGNNGDWVNSKGTNALTNNNSAGGTTLYFGNAAGLADAQDAARNHGYGSAPEKSKDEFVAAGTGEKRNYSDYLGSLDKTARDRRKQVGYRNDMIVASGASALVKMGIPEGQTRAALDTDALRDMNQNLENAGATYRVTGIMMQKDAFGKPMFTISTIERNGKQYVHQRTAEEMYDVAVGASRGLRELRGGNRTTPAVDAKGNPTGYVDEDNQVGIGMFGDARGVQKAWEQRNADSIAQREAMKQKMELDRQNSRRNFQAKILEIGSQMGLKGGQHMTRDQFQKMLNENPDMGYQITHDMSRPVWEVDENTGKLKRDKNNNPIQKTEPVIVNGKQVMDENGMPATRPMFEKLKDKDAIRQVDEAYREHVNRVSGANHNNAFADLLQKWAMEDGGANGQNGGASATKTAQANGGEMSEPAPTTSSANAPAPAHASTAASEPDKSAQNSDAAEQEARYPAQERTDATSDNAQSQSKSNAPSEPSADVIRPPVAIPRDGSGRRTGPVAKSVQPLGVGKEESVENYKTAPASDDEWNAAAKDLGIYGFDKVDGEYKGDPEAALGIDEHAEKVRQIMARVVSRRRQNMVKMFGKERVDRLDAEQSAK